jgi:excisionase family DNA binding protein
LNKPRGTNHGSGDGVEPLLLHASDVATLLGIGRSKVSEMASAGELPVVKIGTAVRFPKKGLLDWIDNHTLRAA